MTKSGGIYLKDNLFVHSTTSRGVILSSLDENYYRKTWVGAGRVKRKKIKNEYDRRIF